MSLEVGSDDMRILHFLNVPMKDIEKDIPHIAEQGFNAIQISSVQPFKNEHDKIVEWFMIFQPLAFKIGNRYGSKEDLTSLCKTANLYNIKIIVDIICNHVANKSDKEPLIPNPDVDPVLTNNPYFWKERKPVENWEDRTQVTHYCMGLPGLDVNNYDLQDIIVNFLQELISCGVGGFRFDAAKSIALPEEHFDYYPNCHFWKRVIREGLNGYDLYNYGEVIFANNELLAKYSKYMNVLTNWYVKELPQTITFVESHDTYLNNDEMGWTKNIEEEEIIRRYNQLAKEWNQTIFFNRHNTNMWKSQLIKEANEQFSKELPSKTYTKNK